MSIRHPSPGPLFIYQSGEPLSRHRLVQAVRLGFRSAGLDLSRYNGHSFRIGAATTAAAVGLPDFLIQTLGRWKSAAFLRYIRTPQDHLAAVTQQLLPSRDPQQRNV